LRAWEFPTNTALSPSPQESAAGSGCVSGGIPGRIIITIITLSKAMLMLFNARPCDGWARACVPAGVTAVVTGATLVNALIFHRCDGVTAPSTMGFHSRSR
jgi:hypothetical protein